VLLLFENGIIPFSKNTDTKKSW